MATITPKCKIDLNLSFTVNESEARALDALVGYGDDAFIEVFYEKLGKAYMRDHEQGLRLFFRSIREQMPSVLRRMDEAKKAFRGR